MCGIVGYIGSRDATPIIINGLRSWSIAAMTLLESLSITGAGLRSEETRASYPNWLIYWQNPPSMARLASGIRAGQHTVLRLLVMRTRTSGRPGEWLWYKMGSWKISLNSRMSW